VAKRGSKTEGKALPEHPVAAAVKPGKGQPGVVYRVSFPKPSTHNIEVEIELSGLVSGEVELRLPSWTPGSYKIREFARNVSHFRAVGSNGRPLAHRQTAKDTWRVTVGKDGKATIAYRVYAFELSVRTPHVDDTHAFFLPTNALMYVEGQLSAPSVLHVSPPKGWSVYCPLPRLKGHENAFVAKDYDVLGDSPVECGAHVTAAFEVDGKRHDIVIHGAGNYDVSLMVRDFPKIVRAAKKMFGDVLPYENYMFILHVLPGNRGGLEHLNSQVSAWPSGNFETREQYEDFLSLISHEFFHLWNVKRIRPEILGPFDYTSEQYTDQLWVMEGITTYYEWLVLVRAGLVPRERVWKALEGEIARWEERPGNAVMPLDESGRLAWTKLYLADENFVNTGVSYYLKGGLVAGILDMEIRRRTKHRKSLDDVMRQLYAEYGLPKRGFPNGGFERACEHVAGSDLKEFWECHLRSTKPLNLESWFDTVGLLLGRESPMKVGIDGVATVVSETPWLGWDVKTGDNCAVVTVVRDGSPASEGGVSAKDEVVAIDGRRVTSASDVDTRVRAMKPGKASMVTLFRDGRLLSLSVTPLLKPAGKPKLVPMPEASEGQRAAMQSWLGVVIDV